MASKVLTACALAAHAFFVSTQAARILGRRPPLLSQAAAAEVQSGGQRWRLQNEESAHAVSPEALDDDALNFATRSSAPGTSAALPEDPPRHRGDSHRHSFRHPGGAAVSNLHSLTRLGQFPELTLPSDYEDPLEKGGLLELERQAMQGLTEASLAGALAELADPNSARLKVTTRNTDNAAATRDVVEYLRQEFEATGVPTCIQSFRLDWGTPRDIYNVIGFVQGASNGSVTLGAHFDDLPTSNASGAEDNGSGTAAVLAALKAFAATGASLNKSIYFVAFGGEEQGLYGSARFAAELSRPGSSSSPIPEACRVERSSDHTAFVMDMIGFRDSSFAEPTVLIETDDRFRGAVADPLARSNQVNNAGGLKLLYSNNPFGSDHMSFINTDLPAALSIDNDGNVYRYPCYHLSCDTLDRVDTSFATDIARMNLGAVLRAASGDESRAPAKALFPILVSLGTVALGLMQSQPLRC